MKRWHIGFYWVGVMCWILTARAADLSLFLPKNDLAGYQAALSRELELGGAEQSLGFNLALAQRELLRVTGADHVAEVAATPAGKRFLQSFLADQEWLELYLCSGPVPEDSSAGLKILFDIFTADSGPDATKYRALATATALVFTTDPTKDRLRQLAERDKNPLTPVGRYFFFKKSHLAHKLRPAFDQLACWELHWLVGFQLDDESLAWLQQNVNLPISRFGDACWIPHYRGVSDFGNTIQGPLFYVPYRGQMCWAEDVARHGGVCGALSTFGAGNAVAHGIPAATMGQPGHCAYGFRPERGKWVGGFGGPNGGVHNCIWKQSSNYMYLVEDLFADSGKLIRSMRQAWVARSALAGGDKVAAAAAFDLALKECPINFPVWKEYLNLSLDNSRLSGEDWRRIADRLLVAFAKQSEPMVDLLELFEAKKLWPGLKESEKTAWLLKVHETVAATEKQSWQPWDPSRLLEKQKAAFGSDLKAQQAFYAQVVGVYLSKGQEYFLGQVIEWIPKSYSKPEEKDGALAAVVAGVQAGGAGVAEKEMRPLVGKLILAAEEAHSIEAFQGMKQLASKYSHSVGNFKLDSSLTGRLVSADGLLYASSYAWDDPCLHHGVLTESGGLFHTKDEEKPWVVVQLKESCELSGILLVNRIGSEARTPALKVSTSSDGHTWMPLAENDKFQQQWAIDLREKSVRAKWVKVEAPHPKAEFFHLRNICIYAKSDK